MPGEGRVSNDRLDELEERLESLEEANIENDKEAVLEDMRRRA